MRELDILLLGIAGFLSGIAIILLQVQIFKLRKNLNQVAGILKTTSEWAEMITVEVYGKAKK